MSSRIRKDKRGIFTERNIVQASAQRTLMIAKSGNWGKRFCEGLAVFICLAIVFCVFPASALSRVTVYDMVVLQGQKVMLRAETRGKLLSKGGELVEFFVDGKSIGKTLSGGDGVAFKQFTSLKTGLRQISVRSDKDEDTGLLLSLKRGYSIVFVDVEGSLLEGLFSWKPKHGSRKAIEEIQKGFSIVYLQTSVVGVEAVKAWIEGNEFPKSPVVSWRQGAIFNEIVKKDLKIKAVIGGPKVIESAEEYEALAFSFEASEDAEKVKDWEEIKSCLMNKFQNSEYCGGPSPKPFVSLREHFGGHVARKRPWTYPNI